MGAQTLQERIDTNRKRRQYLIAFSILALFALNALTGLWINHFFHSLAGFGYVLVPLFLVLLAYPLTMSSAVSMVSRTLKARPCAAPEFDRIRSPLEDAALAAGIARPDVLLFDRDYCGAFSLMQGGRGVIFITRGMLEQFGVKELQGVFAHEAAHIACGDLKVNNIIAFLGCPVSLFGKPLTNMAQVLISLLMLPLIVLTFSYPFFDDQYFAGYVFIISFMMALLYILVFAVLHYLFTQQYLQASNMLADERAVRWTLEPETLVMAMRKPTGCVEKPVHYFLNLLMFAPVDVRSDNPELTTYRFIQVMERRRDIVERMWVQEKPNLPADSVYEHGVLTSAHRQADYCGADEAYLARLPHRKAEPAGSDEP